jgi:hypothetical protein
LALARLPDPPVAEDQEALPLGRGGEDLRAAAGILYGVYLGAVLWLLGAGVYLLVSLG